MSPELNLEISVNDLDLLFLDLEMNQPSGKIIQVGYVMANPIHKTIRFIKRIYVNANETLNPEIIKLTGITQEQVDSGVSLQEAYNQIKEDLREQREDFGNPCFINPVTWGGNDAQELRIQLGMEGDHFLFGRRCIDTKTLFVSWAVANGQKPMGGLSTAMKKLKLRFQGRKHDACDDAFNTMFMYWKLMEFYKVPPTLIEQVNAAPELLRKYVHDIETSYGATSEMIQQIYALEEALRLANGAIKLLKENGGKLP